MIVAGVDEVGRGSIAGPLLVLAAAFEVEWAWQATARLLPAVPCPVPGVKDSKAFSSRKRRAEVAALLEQEPSLVGKGLGIVTSADINGRGMTWALAMGFRGALERLPKRPDLVLIDGDTPVPSWEGPQVHQSKADVDWWPVSAASVLAKVLRDGWMENLNRVYPGYGWAENAGYGTPGHIEAIRQYGTTPIHRMQFVQSALRTAASKKPNEGA
jgi:ribonuclease HII